MRYLLILSISLLRTFPTFAGTLGSPTPCQEPLKACQDLIEAQDGLINQYKQNQADLEEALVNSEAKPKATDTQALAYVSVAGIGAIIGGPVGAIVGTGLVAIVSFLGGF